MNFDKNDFKACLINPLEDLTGALKDKKYSGLSGSKLEGVDAPEKLLTYIICFYDRDSPLRAVSDINDRKKEACKIAGLHIHDSNTESIIHGEHEGFCEAVIYYLRSKGDRKFALLAVAEAEFYKILFKIQNNKMEEFKGPQDALEQADVLDIRIRDYMKDVFSENNENLEATLMAEMEDTLELLAESYARDD